MDNVFIGLGSNLKNPLSQLKKAIENINQLETVTVNNVSSFYSSPPMGPQEQPDYINAVIELSTILEPESLLDALQNIEQEQGRVRKERWGARTLDLDILLYGNEIINNDRLIVPHSGIRERNFVLYPLRELVDENFDIPEVGNIKELLATCSMDELKRLSET